MRQLFGQLLVARLEALAMAAPGGETVHQDVLARFLARRHGRWTLNLQGTGLAYTFRPGKLQGEDPEAKLTYSLGNCGLWGICFFLTSP